MVRPMDEKQDMNTSVATTLRCRAEVELKAKTPEVGLSREDNETQRLFHEL
jgi:hypothetical protein